MKGKKIIFELEGIIEVIVYFIIFVKFLFLLTAVGHVLLSHSRQKNAQIMEYDEKIVGWKSKFEFTFVILMSCLLIFIFTPWANNYDIYMTSKIRLLFYLLGFILIITADWGLVMPKTSLRSVIDASLN